MILENETALTRVGRATVCVLSEGYTHRADDYKEHRRSGSLELERAARPLAANGFNQCVRIKLIGCMMP
jgi:hypothetical protein